MDSIKDLLKDCLIFNSNFLTSIIYTDINPVIIESLDVKKVNSQIMRIKNVETFNLKKFSCTIDKIKEVVDKEFLDVIKSSNQTVSIDYYQKGIFKLFKKNKTNNLLSKCLDCSWSLSSEAVSKNLITLKDIKVLSDNNLTNKVFLGNNESIMIILNNKFLIEQDTVHFELLIYNKNIRKIILE